MIVAFVLIGKRALRAIQIVTVVASDRELQRRLPWPYLRDRLVNDRWMLVRVVGNLTGLVLFPVAIVLSRGEDSVIFSLAMLLWIICLVVPSFRRE